jgi:hypothetical protein
MNIPNFTATLSLKKTTLRHASPQALPASRGHTEVVPSYISPWKPQCLWPCWIVGRFCICPLV